MTSVPSATSLLDVYFLLVINHTSATSAAPPAVHSPTSASSQSVSIAAAEMSTVSFEAVSKANLPNLQAESAGKKYEKAAKVKEHVARKKEAMEPIEPPSSSKKRKAAAEAKEDHELTASQIKIASKALDRAPSGEQQEKQRRSFIHKYELYHKCLPRDLLPSYVKGSANWTWREASVHYNAIRAHLNGANNLELQKELYFQMISIIEQASGTGALPGDLDLQGVTQTLRQNQEVLETELTEMCIELSDLTPPTPWYVRLGIKTGRFLWAYSEGRKKAAGREELKEAVEV